MLKTTFDPMNETPLMKALFYGAAGAGKTHLAASYRGKVLYVLTEPQGKSTLANTARLGTWNPENQVYECYSWSSWLDFINHVNDEFLSGFDLLVVDTIDHLDDYNTAAIAAASKKEAIEQIGDYGASRSAAISRLHQFVVNWIAKIPVNCLVLAHQVIREVEENDVTKKEVTIRIFGKATEILAQKFNLIGHLSRTETNGKIYRSVKFRGSSAFTLKDHPALDNIETDLNEIVTKFMNWYGPGTAKPPVSEPDHKPTAKAVAKVKK